MLLALWQTPRARVFVGFVLGYVGVQVLAAAAVQLVGQVDEARDDGYGRGYAQARRELADEFGLTLDDEPLRADASPVDEPAVDAWAASTDDPQA